ncbi:V-type ATPase 116kDa subunit family protein [Leptolyngbya sp. FACHB-261]|uniref:V-type ATPase 116kDa subunit family protein n=1 Tax=Leptolyngbya sp. FACHB-261 TaxID=2692806 RepID=UPI001686DC75|nr:V-type ATPase 116kDa subunit family protein [Leptolyngbya sp. FACHB-261]MBD2105222.1 hypothetical protein [Leptolyngbya sp. FACHB-261]
MKLPFTPLEMPSLSEAQIQNRLEDVEDTLENSETRRIGATRFIESLRDYLNQALSTSKLNQATHLTHDEIGLFVIQAWCPVNQISALDDLVKEFSLALTVEDPGPQEQPPTLVQNSDLLAPGETLISVYGTPSYRSWGPSALIYVSFVLFFGIIIADAGYGFLLLGIAWLLRGKLLANSQRRLFYLFAALGVSASAYGLLSGEYFAVDPPEGSLLARIAIFKPDLENIPELMAFSVSIGCLHVLIANAIAVSQCWSALRKGQCLSSDHLQ